MDSLLTKYTKIMKEIYKRIIYVAFLLCVDKKVFAERF